MQATKDAGVIAGMDVMRIINEPTAAAIADGRQGAPGMLPTDCCSMPSHLDVNCKLQARGATTDYWLAPFALLDTVCSFWRRACLHNHFGSEALTQQCSVAARCFR